MSCTYLGSLGVATITGIVSICCCAAQGAKVSIATGALIYIYIYKLYYPWLFGRYYNNDFTLFLFLVALPKEPR
jgi:hypothetical protein